MDGDKARQLDCGACNKQMQALRNCSGSGSPAKIELNGNLYRRCPKAIYLESFVARYLVGVYFECRNHTTYPAPGSWGEQTAFTGQLFDFLDNVVADTRARLEKAQKQEK